MTTLSPNGDEDIIADFIQQFERAADKDSIVRQFAGRHPTLGPAFADYAAGHSLLKDAGRDGATVPHLLKPGEMLGDFRVVRFVTHGGMGEIYEAEQIRLSKRRVALKVIRRGQAVPEVRARFEREQAVLAKLHQTNIVPVFANGERGEVQYFAMQFIDGATLGHVVKLLRTRDSRPGGSNQTSSLAKLVERAAGPPTPATDATPLAEADTLPATPELTEEYVRSVVESLADVADGLHAAHEAGVVHRDVKPSNLMAEKSGKCWVIDFGLAGIVGEATASAGTSPGPRDAALTGTGSVLGTYAYMAPEQFRGEADRRTDVWALGVTLYELLALDRPFAGPTHDYYARQVQETEPRDLRTVSRAVPPDLAAICRKAMRKDAAERYQTAESFASDLRHWLRNEPTAANPPWVGRRVAMWAHRQPGWASMVGVAVAAGLGLSVLLLDREQQRTAAEKARAELAGERAAAVEERAAEAERQHAREKDLGALEREYLSSHSDGWRDQLWKRGRRLAQGHAEPELRDRMAVLLGGLDAKLVFEHNDGPTDALSFDPTGRRLLYAAYDRVADRTQPSRARLLNLESREANGTSPGPVHATAWRGNEAVQLVAPISRSTLELCEVGRNRRLDEFTFPDKFRPIPDVVKAVAVMSARSVGIPLLGLPGPAVEALSVSAGGTHVAALVGAAKDSRSILVWKAGQQAPIAIVPTGAVDPVHFGQEIALSPDGNLLALGMDDGRVRVWSLAGGPRVVAALSLGSSRITALAFARHRDLPDPARQHPAGVPGWLLAAGNGGGEIAVWDLGLVDRVMFARDSLYEVFALAFSPDAVTLYSGGRNEVRAWDVATGQRLLTIQPGFDWISSLAVSPTGARLAVGTPWSAQPGNPGRLLPSFKVYDLERGRGIDTLHGLAGQIRRLATTPGARRIAALTDGFQIGVWDRDSGHMLLRSNVPPALYADHADARLTDDGRHLIVASGELARWYELPANAGEHARLVGEWKLAPAFSNRLAITPGGTVLLARTETLSGKQYSVTGNDPAQDPRRVVFYRLSAAEKPVAMHHHDEHPWHVFEICPVPDGSCFAVIGTKARAYGGTSVVGYSGGNGERLWSVSLPKSKQDSGIEMDSSGQLLVYGNPQDGMWVRDLPFTGGNDEPLPSNLTPAYGRRYRFVSGQPGLPLADFASTRPFLNLEPDRPFGQIHPRFTPDGRYLAWGDQHGALKVADLAAIQKHLVSVGFSGW